jgi:hypothetical protein
MPSIERRHAERGAAAIKVVAYVLGSILVVAALGGAGYLAIMFSYSVPIAIHPHDEGQRITVRQVRAHETGETTLRVMEGNPPRVVWAVRPPAGRAAVWSFTLRSGENPVGVGLEPPPEVLTPAGQERFVLEPGRRYEIEIETERGGATSTYVRGLVLD